MGLLFAILARSPVRMLRDMANDVNYFRDTPQEN